MATTLSIFSWDDDNTEGFREVEIDTFNNSNEIDMSRSEAEDLIQQLQTRLDDNENITLRISN